MSHPSGMRISEPSSTGTATIAEVWKSERPSVVLEVGAERAEQAPGVEADRERERGERELGPAPARAARGAHRERSEVVA